MISVEQSSRASILVVDGDDSVLTLVHFCLKHAGYTVTSARGREPVLSLLASGSRFDLVITDLLMPEIDGVEVIAATKVYQPGAAILTMSTGAHDLPGKLQLRLPQSADIVPPMMKPFHLEELLVTVERALQRIEARAGRN